jgi:HlyD family secretion protein
MGTLLNAAMAEEGEMAAITGALGAAGARRVGPGQLLVVLLVFAAAAAAGFVAYGRLLAAPRAAPIAGTPARVQRGTVAATVSTTGSVVSNRQSKLAVQVAGRLVDVPVKLGDQVKAGQVLARVDPVPLQLKLQDAETALQTARVKLDQLKAGSRPEDVAAAEAAVASAQAKLADVQAGATPQDITAAQAAVDAAAANVRDAQAKLDAVNAGSTPADISAAQNGVTTAQANLQKAQAALDTLKAGAKPEDIRAQELAVEQAKNNLWSQQMSRDGTCGRGHSSACDAANAAVASAESAVSQAQVKLQQLKLPPDPKDVAQKQADVDAATDALRNAQVKLAQVTAGPAAQDVQAAQSALDSAQANYRSAVAKLDLLKQGSKAADVQAAQSALVQAQQTLQLKKQPNTVQDIQLAELQVKSAENAVAQAKLDLDNAALTAPYDGVVGAIAANVGEQVGSGTQVLTIVDPKQTRVDVTVDESDIAKIAPGKTAQITFDALPEQRLTGKVIGIAPNATVTQGVATYAVSVSIDDATQPVPVGLTANVNIVTQQRDNTLFVPNRAIRRQGRNQVVDVLFPDGRRETRTITTGLGNDQVTEVTDGLSDGETVIIPATTTSQPRVGGFGGPPGGLPR